MKNMKNLNERQNRIEALKSGMTETQIATEWMKQEGYVICEIVRM